ncbi:PP2C family protein-serine/threonine phosphatase [Haliovirga abyssi]|uniref:PPM-type phosphatase domain-containing protein n=1 Tax=Haliovirga abyssi TaxID=2996794 RepID=A0AAU9DV02_9FUSO|nr:PP2C family protein-serine/threonine phosphatase [Haliovirga abyssi]BDU49906.1 hypothetical protein HLVA_04750 [Haliovirga abyssi]
MRNIIIFTFFSVIILFFEYSDYFEYKKYIISVEEKNELNFIENLNKDSINKVKNREVYNLNEKYSLKEVDFYLGKSLSYKNNRVKYVKNKLFSKRWNYIFVRDIRESLKKLNQNIITKSFETVLFFILFLMFVLVDSKNKTYLLEIKHKEDLEKDLNKAKAIQDKLFKEINISKERYQIKSFYKSYREVGGDFYGIEEISKGKYFIYVGDSAGHGLHAALISSFSKITIENLRNKGYNILEIVEELNNNFLTIEGFEDYYVTLFLGIFDFNLMELEYLSCGHEIPFALKDNKIKDLFTAKENNMVIGMLEEVPFIKNKVKIEAGVNYLIYTDGILDTIGEDELKRVLTKYGEEGVKEILKNSEPKDDMSYIEVSIK